MHLSYQLVQRGRSCARANIFLWLVAASFVTAEALLPNTAFGQFQIRARRTQVAGQETTSDVYLPTDRSLSRAITRARERLADHEYHEVLAFLQGVLARDEDSFLERTLDEYQQPGLKATARRLIGELPPEGHEAYELLHGAIARRQLEAAIRAGDRDAIAKVVRQYFHTTPGYEAALVLAEMEADQGHRLAAAELYRELIDTPRAAARFEPQLSVAAALNLLLAGQSDDAASLVRAIAKAMPSAQLSISGKDATLPAASADPIAWLSGFAGQVPTAVARDANWLTLHGDPSRNVQSTGGRPHLRPRWEARIVNEPSVESLLSDRSDDFLQRGIVKIPGARPIAVGDVVIMRTPENIVAIDWKTGKRIWESRDEQELQPDLTAAEASSGIDRDQWSAQGKPLEDRVWHDALVTSLSSDGKRVFVVRGLSASRDDENGMAWQPQFMNRSNVENIAPTNQLAAYDIATQGKLTWELDGGRNAGKLTGAFFLGAPLAIDNTLYVMAEIGSALYLVALNPATGEVQWQQQLLKLVQSIAHDPARRRAGVTPSYAGGILICPTGAGTVVAIDVVKREFAWVYSYPREVQSVEMRNFWPNQPQPQLMRGNNQWLDSSCIIAEGKVLVTSPESPEIYCLDLQSGKLLWNRRQGDSLFVGGVDHGNVLLIGGPSVSARRLSDGEAAWEKEALPLPSGVLPAGQGYMSEGRYFLPLTSGQIAEIDLAAGKLATFSPAGPNVALGNLICYRGSVISQSPLVVDKFEQFEVLRKRTEGELARNANDAVAIRQSAELKRADDQKSEAVRLLKRAYELAPDDLVTQELLAEVLLEELADDYATFHADVPLASKLIHNREQQIELLRLDAAGLDASGQHLAAWDAYLRLADFTAEEPAYLRIQDQYIVRSDRWISGRLAAMWSGASADERKTIEKKLAARRPNLKSPRTAAELRHYLAHLDELPGANEVRLALATYLIGLDRPQEAEIELLQSLASKEQPSQSAATELLAKLAAKSGKQSERAATSWPSGHADAQLTSSTSPSQPRDRAGNVPNQGQPPNFRQLRIEQDFFPQAAATNWFISNECNEIVGRNLLGADVFRVTVDPNIVAKQYRDSSLIRGARLGHLLYVVIGGQPLAIDSRQDHSNSEADVLWPNPSQDAPARDVVRPRRSPTSSQTRNNRRPLYHAFGRKRLNGTPGAAQGSLGPVTPRGVVCQDDNELKCVDPISGTTLWTRTDIPLGCELFGDGELVFAADLTSKVVYVIRFVDGHLLDKRDRPAPEWLLTSGRNVAYVGTVPSTGSRPQLTVTDIWSQKPLYQTDLSDKVRYSVIEPNAVAVLESTGQFRLIDVAVGKVVIDEKLDVPSDLQNFHTFRSGDDLFVFISGQPQSQVRAITQTFDNPIINGPVFAFSMKTGKPLWPGPATVRNRGIMLTQPPDLPFLVFADRQQARNTTETITQLRVLCVDKRTGETVYRDDRLQDSSIQRFRIEAQREPSPQVTLEMGASKLVLAMTDRPRPPQPPMNDDLEATREIVERGIRGVGVRLGGALRGALENGTQETPNQQPQKQTKPRNGDPKQAKNPADDTDDD